MPQAYWIIPLEGGHPDNSLPGYGHVGGGPTWSSRPSEPRSSPAQPGHPSQPIYHPGHPDHGGPVDPGYGQGGRPHPGNRPPGKWGGRGHIDNSLPEGEDVEISNELPEVPAEYADKVIVAIKRPNVTEWTVKAYDVDLGHRQLPCRRRPSRNDRPRPFLRHDTGERLQRRSSLRSGKPRRNELPPRHLGEFPSRSRSTVAGLMRLPLRSMRRAGEMQPTE